MKIKINKINDYVYHLIFRTQFDLTSTLIRFEEFYENSNFKAKIFTLSEFKEWYKKHTGKKKFTYYQDWHGYNIPSNVLKPFYDGKFNPLTRKEKHILDLFKDIKGEFFIIGTFLRDAGAADTLRHELTHALFDKNKEYRKEVIEYFKGKKFEDLEKLFEKWGYSKHVYRDEINAYLVNDLEYLKKKGKIEIEKYRKISKDLNAFYNKYK